VDDQNQNLDAPNQPASKSPWALIIGYGNSLRGDDALGPQVAEKLSARFRNHPGIHVKIIHQLTMDVAESLSNFSLVILIDARRAEPVGEPYIQEIQPSQDIPQPFSHDLKPQELLGICQVLYNSRPKMILAGINASNFDVGDPVSPMIQNRIPELIRLIEGLL